MLKIKYLAFIAIAGLFFAGCRTRVPKVKEGDLIFQSSNSDQAKAIELATHSTFSHVGMVLKHDGKLMVYEAVGPVKFTLLGSWIHHGRGHKYVLMRLKNPLADSTLTRMEAKAVRYAGKNYDPYFDWSDKDMYCSELVWKMYKWQGIELCPLKKFRDYDFSNPIVQAKLKERFGNAIPMDENIVSPEDLSKSTLLTEVDRN